MVGSDQIKKLQERNEKLQKQLDSSKHKVSELQDKLKRTSTPPLIPKDDPGSDKDRGEVDRKVKDLTEQLEKQKQEFDGSMGKLREELHAARRERDEFTQQLQTLRESLITGIGSPPEDDQAEEPKNDPDTQKYKLSWAGDSLKDPGKKRPQEKKKESAAMDRRTTEEKMAAMAAEQKDLEKKKEPEKEPEKTPERQEEKKEPEGKKQAEEELEDTASYSVEELLAKAEGNMDIEALKDLKDRNIQSIDRPTVPGVSLDEMVPKKKPEAEDSDVALVTSESSSRPILRMHDVPEEDMAEPPTFQEDDESLIAEGLEDVDTDKRTDAEVREAVSAEEEQAELQTEEKAVEEIRPWVSIPFSAQVGKLVSENRALLLKSLLFLAGAGLGVGLALLIFLGPDTKESAGEEGVGVPEKTVEEPTEAEKEQEKTKKPDASGAKKAAKRTGDVPAPEKELKKAGKKDSGSGKLAGTKLERAPSELVEPLYNDAAVMDEKEAGKVGAALKVFVGQYPRDPLLRYHYARALYHRGDMDAAVKQLEAAMKLDPDMPEVHYMLGGVYLRMGQEEKAHKALNNFTRLTGKPKK